ncbi:MAG: hypothetical protein GWN58_33345 [Anaerolineae bacterium]|nr:hypothetical protein [Thermoplasmata archaeon]NIV34162.1 hypothetical protein [Anaerolineae bacterium]NIY06013.1 hypothetical protein [Thermoplasmata archaeon]
MPDKEKATKLLGFRDDKGALVCPADVVDPSKSYTCHVGAEDGSYEPSDADLKVIGDLFKAVGLTGSVTKVKGKGGTTFFNKKGVVICRIVEGAAPPPPKPKKVETKVVEPEKTEPKDTTKEVKDAEAQAKAADAAAVKTTKKKTTKKKQTRQKKPTKRGK